MKNGTEKCWICGTALEVWPLQDKQELITKHASDSSFRLEFAKVRAGVAAAEVALFRKQEVTGDQSCGIRVAIRAGLIEVDIFKIVFELPPSLVNIKVVDLIGPDLSELHGVVVDLQSIPKDVPYYEAELFFQQRRQLCDVLLAPGDIRREGHAKDRYVYAVNNMCGSRAAC